MATITSNDRLPSNVGDNYKEWRINETIDASGELLLKIPYIGGAYSLSLPELSVSSGSVTSVTAYHTDEDSIILKEEALAVGGVIYFFDAANIILKINNLEASDIDIDLYIKVSYRINTTEDGLIPITDVGFGVPLTYTKQTASGEKFTIQQGILNKLRIRPQILNEQCESSRDVKSVVTSTNIVGQIFKASQDNINGINLAMESAAEEAFDDFESYADDAALQATWVADGELAELETTNVFEGNKAMLTPTAGNTGDTWKRLTALAGVNFTGYTGQFAMYSNKEYKDVKMRVFLEDTSGNISSTEIITVDKDAWYEYVIIVDLLEADVPGSPADLTLIKYIGFEVEKEKRDGYAIFDILVSVPPPGNVNLKLWNMGAILPEDGVTSIDDGTQYTKLGDLGIGGQQVSEISLSLLGGFRTYHIDKFIAGVALEMGNNELLIPDNYYAITINYVDTDVSVYGPSATEETRYEPSGYYTNGYAFTAPDEATKITKLGTYKDIMFTIYSTQDVYVINVGQVVIETPGDNALASIYMEDDNMFRTTTFITGIQPTPVIDVDSTTRPAFLMKGGKLEEEYNDDFSDDVESVVLGFTYLYIPPTVNG